MESLPTEILDHILKQIKCESCQKYCDQIKLNKAGHLLSEPGFDPHSTPQFRDLSSNFAKQNSTP